MSDSRLSESPSTILNQVLRRVSLASCCEFKIIPTNTITNSIQNQTYQSDDRTNATQPSESSSEAQNEIKLTSFSDALEYIPTTTCTSIDQDGTSHSHEETQSKTELLAQSTAMSSAENFDRVGEVGEQDEFDIGNDLYQIKSQFQGDNEFSLELSKEIENDGSKKLNLVKFCLIVVRMVIWSAILWAAVSWGFPSTTVSPDYPNAPNSITLTHLNISESFEKAISQTNNSSIVEAICEMNDFPFRVEPKDSDREASNIFLSEETGKHTMSINAEQTVGEECDPHVMIMKSERMELTNKMLSKSDITSSLLGFFIAAIVLKLMVN